MSNLNGIPSADYFETRLANLWSGINGVVHVEAVPAWSLPAGEYSYIVVNPWESNMQVAKVDWWDSDALTFNVIDAWNTSAGIWDLYEVKPHPAWSKVRFSNNYAFWKDIQEAVNSKADDSSISAVWKSNDYGDLDNKPAISTVWLSNDYNDLDNLPTPVSIDWADKILNLSWSNVLSATVSASYNSWTKKITLYGKNSEVLSEIDCTAFIKDGMIQDVKIVTDPVGYAPWKYLEFDFNTDSGTEDIYIALSDLAVYTAGDGISINNNTVSVTPATANKLWWIKVWSWLTINDGTLSANSQTDENYTTAEKTKLAWIESGAQVNVIEKVQVNWTDLTISWKSVNVQIKTINGNSLTWSGDLDLMARHYTEWTWITINASDEISISSAYQTTIGNKANSADLATVATSWNYSDLVGTPEDLSDFNNDTWFITSADLSWYQTTANMVSDLTWADDDHYPTAKAVSDAIQWAWAWDMLAATYDPNNVAWDAFDTNNMNNRFAYWVSTTAAATVQKEVSIPDITKLEVWQVIIVKPTVTSTVANSTLKLNNFAAYDMLYNGAAISTSTDSIVWSANVPSLFYLDDVSWTKYWRFLGHWLDSNTTYTLNYLFEAWKTQSWSGSYAVSRYSLVMQKADGTWEKLTATNANYSTWTSKSVNTNWFIPTQIRYYNTTTVLANGAYAWTNTMQEKCAKLTASYSFNCGTAPWWTVWQNIYLVWTISNWLFYLDTTTRWSTTLPNSADWKVYILLWQALSADDSTMTLTELHPIFFHDWTNIREYYTDKQDRLISWTNLKTINNNSLLGSWDLSITEFNPDNAWSTDQVLTKTADWYEWATPSSWWWDVMSETDYGQITPQNDFLYFTYE